MRFRLSRFAHILGNPHRQAQALWHALNFELYFLEPHIALMLSRFRGCSEQLGAIASLFPPTAGEPAKFVAALVEKRLLVPESENEDLYPTTLAEQAEQAKYISVLYLMLSDGCNLRCRYCFEDNHAPQQFLPMQMSEAVARAGLDTFAALIKKYPPPDGHESKIQLYGGEPLLNVKTFIYSVRYFQNLKQRGLRDDRVSLATVTNGAFVTPELADFIVENNISVGISIDGKRCGGTLARRA